MYMRFCFFTHNLIINRNLEHKLCCYILYMFIYIFLLYSFLSGFCPYIFCHITADCARGECEPVRTEEWSKPAGR